MTHTAIVGSILGTAVDREEDVELLREERKPGQKSQALVLRLAKLIEDEAGGDPGRHQVAIQRLEAAGLITLLIDGLGHVSRLGQTGALLQ